MVSLGMCPCVMHPPCKLTPPSAPCRKEIVSGLAVAGGKPQYKGTTLVTSSGPLTVAADMPDGAGIH